MRKNTLYECEIIRQNCEYTADTHYITAKRHKSNAIRFQIFPALVTALSGLLVVGEIVPTWWGWIVVINGVISAVATVLDPMNKYFEHRNAADNFTILKHDARAMKDTLGKGLSDKELHSATQHLHNRYNDLLRFSPPTNDKDFKKASERIKSGIHKPDEE